MVGLRYHDVIPTDIMYSASSLLRFDFRRYVDAGSTSV